MKKKIWQIVFVSLLLLATPFAFAEDNETTAQKTPKAYAWGEQTMDKIRLWFAWKDEQKLGVMTKIQERREQHYQFLMQNNKTEQADAFKVRTSEMTQNFEQQRAKIQEKLGEKEAQVQERVQQRIENAGSEDMIQEREQIRDPTTHNATAPLLKGQAAE